MFLNPIGNDGIFFMCSKTIYHLEENYMEKTIKNLVNQNTGKVYVYLANDEIGNKFMQQAENEGFAFNDGAKPTSRCYAEIMAVNKNYTINFVGSIGRMAFGSGAETVNGEKLIRVDYEKYVNEESDYFYRKA